MRTEKFTVNNNDMEKLYYWNHYQSYLFQLMNDKTYNKQHHHALVWMVRYLGNTNNVQLVDVLTNMNTQ